MLIPFRFSLFGWVFFMWLRALHLSPSAQLKEKLWVKFLQCFRFTWEYSSHISSWVLGNYIKEIENLYTIKHFLIHVASCFVASQHFYQLTLWRNILVWSEIHFFFVSLGKTEISLLCTSFVSAHCIAKLFKSYLLYSFQI